MTSFLVAGQSVYIAQDQYNVHPWYIKPQPQSCLPVPGETRWQAVLWHIYHDEAWTKCLTFCRKHFQIHFLEWKKKCFLIKYFTEVWPRGSNWKVLKCTRAMLNAAIPSAALISIRHHIVNTLQVRAPRERCVSNFLKCSLEPITYNSNLGTCWHLDNCS